MPYITQGSRSGFSGHVGLNPKNAGELNYVFTTIAKQYLVVCGEKYQTYNDIIGALEGCKLELYARKVRPYEDKKIEENGDVF